jgi:hypothetical protein
MTVFHIVDSFVMGISTLNTLLTARYYTVEQGEIFLEGSITLHVTSMLRTVTM